MRKMYSFILLVFIVMLGHSCTKTNQEIYSRPDVEYVSSKVATDWMNVYRKVVQLEAKNPPHASRIYAYGAVGLYQAVYPGLRNYKSLEGQIAGLVNMPSAELLGSLDYTSSANEAMYQLALKIFGALKPESVQAIEAVYKKYNDEMQLKSPADLIVSSRQYGFRVAAAVLERSYNDGFAATRNLTYTVPSSTVNPSYWSPTGPVTSPLEPYWGKLKCFAMTDGAACTIPSSIEFSLLPSSEFYKQAEEVLNTSLNLTNEQKVIAEWWADNAGATPTPPGHWVGIAASVAEQQKLGLGKTAELFATLNIALADAFISCWDEKYRLNLLRPVSYIRNFVPGHSNWSSYISTPPFPEYPSGHSVASGAAADILTQIFGNISFVDDTNVNLGLPARRYNSFQEAANEAAISRLYGGIHFREAIDNGLKQGVEVSKAVHMKIKFR